MRSEERQPLINSVRRVNNNKWTRWYVIVMASLSNILNNNQWAYWGPIAQSAKAVYGWTDTTIFILINITNAAGFLSTFIGSYIVDRKGIRVALLCCFCLLALSTLSKVFTTKSYPATVLIGFGQLFNGLASSVTGAIPPAVSEVWFPLNERATATAIVALAAGLGSSTSFIIGPLAVSMPFMNGSKILMNDTDVHSIHFQIQHLNYATFAVSLAILLLCFVYLPAKPPSPPSITACCGRYDFKQGMLSSIRRPNMWLLGIIYGVAIGSYGSWASVIDILVNPLGITQTEAGWIGFYGGVGGVLGGIFMGRIADKLFRRRMKLLLVVVCILVAVCFGWFTFQCSDIVPRSTSVLYVAVILGSILASSSIPIFIEIACEASYPVAEGLTSGFLELHINLTATVFLLINLIPHIGTVWMNWWVTCVFVAIVPMILLIRVRYQRFDIDTCMR